MLTQWMRFVLAVLILPTTFTTEYFIVAKWVEAIHISWWWIIFTILVDMGDGLLLRALITGKFPS